MIDRGRMSGEANTLGLGDPLPSRRHRYGALAVCIVLTTVTVLAMQFGARPGPVILPFLPITATVWCLADGLTAFLLLAQFYVNGRISFAILAVGYALSGLLTCPYLLVFPGIFWAQPGSAHEQSVSAFFWIAWHCLFPTFVIVSVCNDSSVKRMVSRRATVYWAFGAVGGALLGAAALTALILTERDALPVLVVNGAFQPAYHAVAVPLVSGINALGCCVLLARRSRLTTLQLWLVTTMVAAGGDGLLQLTSSRYSYAWEAGKLITVFTSSVVLIMILCEIAGLYGRLAQAARIDPLTGLPNRRAFEDHLQIVLHNAQRLHSGLAMLVVDIDLFKNYNDTYGHAAGDEALRAVAATLPLAATRPLDLVARFGGEEFVAILPDTPLPGVFTVAEQIRTLVETLALEVLPGEFACVTVSVGVGFAPDAAHVTAADIFEAADRGLYASKALGRNCVTLGGLPQATERAECAA